MATRRPRRKRKAKPNAKRARRGPGSKAYEYVRAFVEKDWGLPERIRLEQAADEYARLGPAGCLRIGDELRKWAEMVTGRAVDPAERAADLEHHIRLHALLAQTSRAKRRR